jgi:hypothetical protein
VVLFELVLVWLLLKSGTYVKVGLGMALAFKLLWAPFWWQGGAIANILVAIPLLWLLRYERTRSIPETLKEKRSVQQIRGGRNV